MFGVVMGSSGIDNYAHIGGFVGGYLTSAFFNPMTRERGDHMIIALGCLVATALAIVCVDCDRPAILCVAPRATSSSAPALRR